MSISENNEAGYYFLNTFFVFGHKKSLSTEAKRDSISSKV